ncbi:MAG: ATP synthase F1 subunit delta [Lachnospiraceae bacterium]|nr:ATP synthase F1 subunit delta [Lachnospiraceae bacterium]MDE6761829.1 ATP synthase F1 subunit delta [Lachnospiraceae bacterium]
MAKQVSKTYGSALFEVAMENHTLDTTLEEVLFVKQTFLENEELGKLLLHPNIEKEEKIKVIESIYKGKVSDEITGLMTMLVTKGHLREFVPVFDYVIRAIKEEKGIGVAYISSAVELNKEQKGKIEQKLLETTKYQKIEGVYQVDQALIGGLVIRIQDTIVDSSLKTQIANLSKTLL